MRGRWAAAAGKALDRGTGAWLVPPARLFQALGHSSSIEPLNHQRVAMGSRWVSPGERVILGPREVALASAEPGPEQQDRGVGAHLPRGPSASTAHMTLQPCLPLLPCAGLGGVETQLG